MCLNLLLEVDMNVSVEFAKTKLSLQPEKTSVNIVILWWICTPDHLCSVPFLEFIELKFYGH